MSVLGGCPALDAKCFTGVELAPDSTNLNNILVLSSPPAVANHTLRLRKSKNYLANHSQIVDEIDACGAPRCAVVCMASSSVTPLFWYCVIFGWFTGRVRMWLLSLVVITASRPTQVRRSSFNMI
jgi:hypothetical protein